MPAGGLSNLGPTPRLCEDSWPSSDSIDRQESGTPKRSQRQRAILAKSDTASNSFDKIHMLGLTATRTVDTCAFRLDRATGAVDSLLHAKANLAE